MPASAVPPTMPVPLQGPRAMHIHPPDGTVQLHALQAAVAACCFHGASSAHHSCGPSPIAPASMQLGAAGSPSAAHRAGLRPFSVSAVIGGAGGRTRPQGPATRASGVRQAYGAQVLARCVEVAQVQCHRERLLTAHAACCAGPPPCASHASTRVHSIRRAPVPLPIPNCVGTTARSAAQRGGVAHQS